MSIQLLIEFIHNLNKCFIHYKTPITIATLSHTIYLIVMLSQINLMFIRFENCSIIGPFIDTLQRLHEYQTSLLLIKY
jgi:hypothetical protein